MFLPPPTKKFLAHVWLPLNKRVPFSPLDDEDKKTLERELFNHELIPQSPTRMSFLEKFAELQLKMLITNQENVQNHNYASEPTEWPFLARGIAYYVSKTSNVSRCRIIVQCYFTLLSSCPKFSSTHWSLTRFLLGVKYVIYWLEFFFFADGISIP